MANKSREYWRQEITGFRNQLNYPVNITSSRQGYRKNRPGSHWSNQKTQTNFLR